MDFRTIGFEIENDEEKQYYINEAIKETRHPVEDIESVVVTLADTDGTVEIDVKVTNEVKFERIRRITGYLVGTVDRWNNAKRKELADRVKHA